jgi:hypothetical protein
VQITEAGSAKRREAQRHWKQAQQQLDTRLGTARIAALHALVDESLALLGDDASPRHRR